MSINRLYHTWFDRIKQLRPDEHITRLRNLAWLLVGIYESKSVHLSKVALELAFRTLRKGLQTDGCYATDDSPNRSCNQSHLLIHHNESTSVFITRSTHAAQ